MSLWIIHITLLSFLSYLSFKYLKSDFSSIYFWLALAGKLLAGITLGLIFFNYYGTGDTITFFELAKNNTVDNELNEPRTQFFITIIRPVVQFSGGSYWITSLWISFISFLACWNAVIVLARLYPKIKGTIAGSILFIPSAVFWSSGLLKDAIAFAALITIISLILKLHVRSKLSLKDLLLLVISAFVLFKIKHYLLITALIFSGFIAAHLILKNIKGKIRWAFGTGLFIILLGATQFIHPYLKIDRVAWTLYENNRAIIQKSDSHQLDIIIADDSWLSVISEIPGALHAGLFRPSILDETPAWGWIHKIENLILSILIFLSLLLWIKLKPKIDWPLFIAATLSILMLAIMLPLSTPNFGTLVRYKSAYVPFLFLICSILPYQYFYSQSDE